MERDGDSSSLLQRVARLGRIPLVLLLVIGILCPYQYHIFKTRNKSDFLRARIVGLPRPETLRLFSFGYDKMISDLLWIQGIQYYAQQFSQLRKPVVEGEPPRGNALLALFQCINVLNPSLGPAYSFGAFVAADSMHDPEKPVKPRSEWIRELRETGGERFGPDRSGGQRAFDDFLVPAMATFTTEPLYGKDAGFVALQRLSDPPLAARAFAYAATAANRRLRDQIYLILRAGEPAEDPDAELERLIQGGLQPDQTQALVKAHYPHYTPIQQMRLLANIEQNRQMAGWLNRMPAVALSQEEAWLNFSERNLLQQIRTAINRGQREVMVKHLLRVMRSIQQRDLERDIRNYIEQVGENPQSLEEVLQAGMLHERQIWTMQDILTLREAAGENLERLQPSPKSLVHALNEFERRYDRTPDSLAGFLLAHLFYPDILYQTLGGLPHRIARPGRMPEDPLGGEIVYVPRYESIGIRSELDEKRAQNLEFLNTVALENYKEANDGNLPDRLEDLVGEYAPPEALEDPYGMDYSLDPITGKVQIEVPIE